MKGGIYASVAGQAFIATEAVAGHMIRQRPYYPALGGVRKSLKRWIALPYHAAAESDSA